METKWICPVCKEKLSYQDKSFFCVNHHQYDQAKEGYVNLLLANQKRSSEPGDPKDSLLSRQYVLNHGFYASLKDAICRNIDELSFEPLCILDAGVGSGYYLSSLMEHRNHKDTYYGIDIGKQESKQSAKACKGAHIAVASVFRLPIEEESMDVVLSIFTPYSDTEFLRVVKPGGYVLAVQPGKRHLFELKEVVYNEPYENEEKGYLLEGFNQIHQENVMNTIELKNQEDIQSLWNMTPYAHTSSKEGKERLDHLSSIMVTTDFYVTIYQKGGSR